LIAVELPAPIEIYFPAGQAQQLPSELHFRLKFSLPMLGRAATPCLSLSKKTGSIAALSVKRLTAAPLNRRCHSHCTVAHNRHLYTAFSCPYRSDNATRRQIVSENLNKPLDPPFHGGNVCAHRNNAIHFSRDSRFIR
jgi:hypothetical protein